MFNFQAKTKIVFGAGVLDNLGAEVTNLNARKALIVTDKGIVKAGLLEKTAQALTAAGIEVAVFDEIEPNPKDTTITAGARYMKDAGADIVVGLGGGSPMDAAKAISMLSVNEEPLEQYCGVGADVWAVTPKPIIAIPTTAGTGSEVSGAAMINFAAKGRKIDLFGRSILPAVAIVDPLLTVGLPPRLTALTGVDALSHALEAYVAKFANTMTDTLAEKAIQLAVDNLRLAYTNGENIEARGNMLLASTMAVMASSAGLGVIHSMAQTIGGYYDQPHGLSIAVCMPLGVKYNLFTAPEKFARLSEILGTNISGMSTIAAAKSAAPAMRELLTDLDITDDMRSLGVREEDIPELAEKCMLDGCTPTNPRPLDPATFAALYKEALTQ